MKHRAWRSTVFVAFVAGIVGGPTANASQPLTFDEVEESVRNHDPRIREAIERLRGAEGNAMSARGAFDPQLSAIGRLLTGGFYDLRRANTELRQATTVWGSEVFVGYRLGLGLNENYPTYYDDETLSGGEIRAGIDLPIWRNGPIDAPRAERKRTRRLEEAAEGSLSSTRLDLRIAAAAAYWDWVAAGQQLQVAQALLALAEERQGALARRLEAGSISEFDLTDNERIVFERKDLLVAAERALQRAAFTLSLFFRDDDGRSVVPPDSRLPGEIAFEPIEPRVQKTIVDRVLDCHPQVNASRAQLAAAEVELALAKNQVAPNLDARFQVSRDLGDLTGTTQDLTLPGTVYEGAVVFSMPLVLRPERGRLTAARAKVEEERAGLKFVQDQLRAQLSDAASAVDAAQERVGITASVVDVADQLARGERRRFESGASNLIFVNLREQQAATARVRSVEALTLAEIEKVRWETTIDVTCVSDERRR